MNKKIKQNACTCHYYNTKRSLQFAVLHTNATAMQNVVPFTQRLTWKWNSLRAKVTTSFLVMVATTRVNKFLDLQ